MKRVLIAILLATFLLSLPIFASARETFRKAGEARQISVGNVAVPLLMQLRRRYYRRRYRRVGGRAPSPPRRDQAIAGVLRGFAACA